MTYSANTQTKNKQTNKHRYDSWFYLKANKSSSGMMDPAHGVVNWTDADPSIFPSGLRYMYITPSHTHTHTQTHHHTSYANHRHHRHHHPPPTHKRAHISLQTPQQHHLNHNHYHYLRQSPRHCHTMRYYPHRLPPSLPSVGRRYEQTGWPVVAHNRAWSSTNVYV
jgi:hypothetical protein